MLGRRVTRDPLATRASLLARLGNRDERTAWQRSWVDFFEAYQGILIRYAKQHGLSKEDADDVVLEIMSGVADRLPSFSYDPGRCRFRTWLFRVAHNRVLDHLRRLSRRADAGNAMAHPDMSEVQDLGMLPPDEAWDLSFEAGLYDAAVARVARRVDPMNMRIFLYHVVDGHNVRETVRRFADSGVSAAKVYLARHRIRRQVDAELALLRKGEVRR